MRILVVGGSGFLGWHIVRSALEHDHEVTLFNRGQTDAEVFPEAEKIRGDRNGDLSGLQGREWDATIDVCGYLPRQVSALLDRLGSGAGHYTFVSTVSVYHEGAPSGYDEEAELVPPSYGDEVTLETYGSLKVGCELAAGELAGDNLLIVRPGYIVGPRDPTHRFTYWVERAALPGPILGPAAEQPVQVIDVRDLASFVVASVEGRLVGVFHATAPDPAISFAAFLGEIAEGIGAPVPEVCWSKADPLLPISADPDEWSLLTASLDKASAAGLSLRPLHDTARDTLAWVRDARRRGAYHERAGVAMTSDEERQALAALAGQDL